ncbi:MAG: HlyD family efflux transporter periplasmic adaptor subunit [Xanthomonadales bacterium PRO6]|nr:HlyD family efflux transporter periplasmic adaptor subunit [Xanthomonadales bacterium PRO6]
MNLRLISLLALLALAACDTASVAPADAGHEAPATADYERGPHRGRMLRDGEFALEVTIFETGVPPEFRLYAYQADQPLPPASVDAQIELTRLGGVVDKFSFRADGDALVGSGVVTEPHSFDVRALATVGGRKHEWSYASHEGRTTIAAAVAEASGIETAKAGPAVIREQVSALGSVSIDVNRQARVRARFPGIVREVRAGLGDTVARGAPLAVVESNDSLRGYTLTAPISGVITARNTNVGDVAGADPLFEITDLSEVWADLHVFGKDLERLAPGQPLAIASTVGELTVEATLDRILPIAAANSQSAIARVRLTNADGRWRPGLAVSADITVAEHPVPLAVAVAGLQRFRDFIVVYAQVDETYEVRMLDLGRRDADFVEVLGGIAPGTTYVSAQSFLIRADIEKSGASHDH